MAAAAAALAPSLAYAQRFGRDAPRDPAFKVTDAHAEMPFAVTRNRPWTGVTINKQGAFPFLIDTGSIWPMIDPALAEKVGLKKLQLNERTHTVGGLINLPVYQSEQIVVGGGVADAHINILGLRQDRVDITRGVIPLSSFDTVGVNFDTRRIAADIALRQTPEGYDSLDLLNAHGAPSQAPLIHMPGQDYDEPQNFLSAGTGSHLNRVFLTPQPIVRAELDGHPVRLLVDTGETGSILLFPHFVRANGLWDHYPKFIPAYDKTVAGDVETRLVRAQQLKIGRFVFDKPVATLSHPKNGGDVFNLADGVIGMELVRRFNFINDPDRRMFSLHPSRAMDDIYRYDRAGLGIERVGDRIEVTEVAEGGPAYRAGLRKGDKVLAWAGDNGGAPGAYFGLLWALQGKPGSLVEIQAESGGKTAVFPVTLEERI